MASERSLRVFLDTNVLYSGFYTPHGTTGEILLLASSGRFRPVISGHVIGELVRNLARKAPKALIGAQAFFRDARVEAVDLPDQDSIRKWTSRGLTTDARIAAAATLAEVDYLCTGDAEFIEVVTESPDGPAVMTPRQLLDLLTL
jgi:predicted nucleic acid-binding protein